MNKIPFTGLILAALISITVKTTYAQDPVFSQPYANPLYLNPAFAGTGNSQRFGLNYQWPNLDGNSYFYNASYDRNFIDSNNGIGFLVNVEKSALAGPDIAANQALTTTNISLIYARQFHIKSFTLSAGVQATYLDLTVDQSKLAYINQEYNWFWWGPQLLRTEVTVPDFSAGILGYGKNYFAGFSVDHLTQPDESFFQGASPLLVKYTANAGINIPIGKVTISPTLLYQKQGNSYQAVAEGYATFWHLSAGLGYRYENINSSDSVNVDYYNGLIFSLGYTGKLLRIGYNVVCPLTTTRTAESLAMNEFSIAVLMPYYKAKRKKVSDIHCPAF